MTSQQVVCLIDDPVLQARCREYPNWGDIDVLWAEQLPEILPDIVLCGRRDLSMAELQHWRERGVFERCRVILLSDGAPNTVLDAAMRFGALYHLRSPFPDSALSDALALSHAFGATKTEMTKDDSQVSGIDQFGYLLGSSAAMRQLYRDIQQVAPSDASVLLLGESGTGKELAAHTVHQISTRRHGPFIAVNCAALNAELIESDLFGHVRGAFTGADRERSGAFAQAHEGTLFLDEITEMPMALQAKLLRVLETGEYQPVGSTERRTANVRIVSASNRDPEQAIREGRLRQDIFYRLAHLPLLLPPLRERVGDAVMLARHFLVQRNAESGTYKHFSPAALAFVAQQQWHGNVRELKFLVERAYLLANHVIEPDHLRSPALGNAVAAALPPGLTLEALERRYVLECLERHHGNRTATAQQLGVSAKTLYNKLQRYAQEAL
ncbi:sigma-54 dependent transcriptional regulator [Salinispirillum sp. LH 10-3-1]|uniref:Sigma-54 dependent transcriptional regulator n=1 Tax=Salinispirillum sp. LH 10-3-1 TaxID=2952525 RepID=A0AB38YGA5_9GAMM